MHARIEIRTKDVDYTKPLGTINDRIGAEPKGTPQHLFIIHIATDGSETVIRGGPNGMNGNMFWDDVKVVKVPYGEKMDGGKPSVDYVENAPRVVIAEGTDTDHLHLNLHLHRWQRRGKICSIIFSNFS